MSSKAPSVADIAYFAGIVDGEGSIAITLAKVGLVLLHKIE